MRLSILALFYSGMDQALVVDYVLDERKNYLGMMFYEEA